MAFWSESVGLIDQNIFMTPPACRRQACGSVWAQRGARTQLSWWGKHVKGVFDHAWPRQTVTLFCGSANMSCTFGSADAAIPAKSFCDRGSTIVAAVAA